MVRFRNWIFPLAVAGIAACSPTGEAIGDKGVAADTARTAYMTRGKCGGPAYALASAIPQRVLADGLDSTDEAVRLWTSLADTARGMGCTGDARNAYRQIISVYASRGHLARQRAQEALESMGPEN